MKKRFLFGDYEPDAVEITGGGKIGLGQCMNVVPVTRGYKAIAGWSAAYANGNTAMSGTIATFTSIIGAINTKNNNGNPVDFFSSTTSIFKADYETAALSAVGGVSPSCKPDGVECFRDMVQYGRYMIAASGGQSDAGDLAYYDHSSPTTGMQTLTSDFKAKTVCAIRDFVMFGHTYDATDGVRVTRVRWSAFGDLFTYTPSAATQADIQDLQSDIGRVQKVIGGQNGYIVGINGTYTADYVGPPLVFRFNLLFPTVGTLHPQSCVRHGDDLYMWSTAGFVRINMSGAISYIGAGRVDQEFNQLVNANGTHIKIKGYLDLENQVIGWQYSVNSGAGSGQAMCYHYPSDKWVQHGSFRSGAYFVYGSDFADGPTIGEGRRHATAHALGTGGTLYANNYVGRVAEIVIGTGFEELEPGRRSIVERVYPLMESRNTAMSSPILQVASIPNANVQIATLDSSNASNGTWNTEGFWTGGSSSTDTGFLDGKYHKFVIKNTASQTTAGQQFFGLDVQYHVRGEY